MKTLILASAAVLTLGFGSAFTATAGAAQPNQRHIAMNVQSRAAHDGQPSNAPATTAHIGGWEPVPPNSMWGGD